MTDSTRISNLLWWRLSFDRVNFIGDDKYQIRYKKLCLVGADDLGSRLINYIHDQW